MGGRRLPQEEAGGHEPGKAYPNVTNVTITGNTFQHGTVAGDKGTFNCGYYWPITSDDEDTVTGNIWDDGTPMTL